MQLTVPGVVGHDVRVVPGRDGVEAEGEGLLEHGRELDALIAAHARVGRAAGRVLGDEVVDDIVAEPLAEIPHIERDAQPLGRATSIQ